MFVEEVEKALVGSGTFQTVISRKKDDCTFIWNGLCFVHKPHERLTLHTTAIEPCVTPSVLTHTEYASLQV